MTLAQDKPPASALVMLGVGLAAVLVIVLLLILPARQETERLQHEIAATTAEIEEKRQLDPVYARMVVLKKSQEELAVPPVPRIQPLNGDIDRIGNDLNQVARTSGMSLVSATPRPASLEGGSSHLLVTVVLEGGYGAFREFMMGIMEIPYLVSVPNFQAREIVDDREFTLELLVLLR